MTDYPAAGPVTLATNLADYPVTRALKSGAVKSDLVKFDFCGPKIANQGFKPMVREGKFDAGWDAYREATLERQKKLGLVPKDVKLAPMPEGTRPWSALSADERRIAARYMEVYAAMLAYSDAQVGRVLDALRGSGELDKKLAAITAAVPHVERGRGGIGALRQTLAAVSARVVWEEPILRGAAGEESLRALLARVLAAG